MALGTTTGDMAPLLLCWLAVLIALRSTTGDMVRWSVVDVWWLAVGGWLVVGWLLVVVGCWLLVAVRSLLFVVCCWLLVVGC